MKNADIKATYYPKSNRFYVHESKKLMRPATLKAYAGNYVIETNEEGLAALASVVRASKEATRFEGELWGKAVVGKPPVTCHFCGDKVSYRNRLRLDGRNYCSADCVSEEYKPTVEMEEAIERRRRERKRVTDRLPQLRQHQS
jgi:hypothetical protein